MKFGSGGDFCCLAGALVYIIMFAFSKYTRWVCDGDVCEKRGWPFQDGLSLVGHACKSAEIRYEESPEFAVAVKSHLTERSSVNRSSEWDFCLSDSVGLSLCAH